ncbi:MAG: N-formylglutamate deformylase [Burkholderiales bacterium]|nr:N-formylglutamate deformylase [Burkholderiales bacterium]
MSLWRLSRGDSPLVIDVPHAGTVVPEAIAARMTANAITLPDTDWHVEKLYAFAAEAGATLLFATHSRYVVDLNRDPAGVALYAGADNTELVPTRSFDNAPIWREGAIPGPDEVAARVDRYFTPYHEALHAEIDRVRARHGHAVVLDGHSIRATVPRFFAGRLPDFNLGTADGASADPSLESLAARLLGEDRAFSSVVNGRFKGGWITRRCGRPREGVHALQLEMAQAAYMDEAPPYVWDPGRAAALSAVLRRLVSALADWRPGRG